MTLSADVQTLEPGDIVTLYILDAEAIGAGTYLFHNHDAGPIVFQMRSYDPWPLEASGFEMSGSALPSPRLSMGNVGGFITALCLQFDDLVGAKLTRKRTLSKYLDGQPTADPDEEFSPDTWYIEQKVGETSEVIEFELASALDFQGVQLPRRQIIANHCSWRYRGPECGYNGSPVADELDSPTADPGRDRCGKRLQSCKLRFGEHGELPYGGFPAAALTR
ncbi:phage minor tail protein L [Halopseudomonas sp. SMJS2]|uniref:phage minor tail protein L n=1 Tax=Halopseudomonas sp. SMJS2 TaxID=3041098 RepID=UPI0024534534|nr:phage minor tail protein L [Halopseudomonas sp. SMJS2]WGK60498.1 phage minor tail protein L [Halopseudomonas sp. SMJS2]